MRLNKISHLALLCGAFTLNPSPAKANYTTSTMFVGGIAMAAYGFGKKKKGMIYGGIALSSAAVAGTAAAYTTYYLSAGAYVSLVGGLGSSGALLSDLVPALAQDLQIGEGPHLDAIRQGYNLSTEEILKIYQDSIQELGHQPVDSEDFEQVGIILHSKLLDNVTLSQDLAHNYLRQMAHDLEHPEIQSIVFVHLEELTGADSTSLRNSARSFLEKEKKSAETTDSIRSLEAHLSKNSVAIIRRLADALEAQYQDTIDRQKMKFATARLP